MISVVARISQNCDHIMHIYFFVPKCTTFPLWLHVNNIYMWPKLEITCLAQKYFHQHNLFVAMKREV